MTLPDTHGGAEVPSHDTPGAPDATPGASSDRRALWTELDQSSIMSVELVSAILVWGGIGWALDAWWGTRPWLLGVGVLLGFAAGLYLVWLRSGRELARGTAPSAPQHRSNDHQPTEGRDA